MPHTATGYAPETLHFGRNLPNGLTLKEIREEAVRRSKAFQSDRKCQYDSKHEASNFDIHDTVLVRIPNTHPSASKFSPKWDGPYVVDKKIGLETYRLKRMVRTHKPVFPDVISCHSSRLKLYFERMSATPG